MLNLVLILISFSVFAEQIPMATTERMSQFPEDYSVIDYKKLALDFDRIVFDFKANNQYWPLVWKDETRVNFDEPMIGLYTTIGDVRQGETRVNGTFHESLANMGAVLGASLVGIDKSKQEYDYVSMLRNYFNRTSGWEIFQNNTNPLAGSQGGGYARDWWYDVYPNVLFFAIYDLYPETKGFTDLARSVADKFYDADKILAGNYFFSYFDYAEMKPKMNWVCAQPDAAAGHSWVLYSAFQKFGDEKYLEGARSALAALEGNTINPSYEVLMPFGALMAAKLNALHGDKFDVEKLLHWSLEGTAVCREGWGVLTGEWNGFDISGIVGSTVDHGGYGFLMNTYDMAWPLLPLVRYDERFADAIGKWALHAVNAGKYFYPEFMPDDHQTLPELKALTKGVVAYEGIAKSSTHEEYAHLLAPVAQGDGPKWVEGNPPVTQFSVYGSAHAGFFGGTVETTNVPGILSLDCLKTDFFHGPAYPTRLYFNPHTEQKVVKLEAGRYYDLISKTILAGDSVSINSRTSRVLVKIPTNGKVTKTGTRLLVDGIVVDYRTE